MSSENAKQPPKVVSVFERTAKNIAAGTMGGIAVCLVGHPFDTLKVRLQTQPVVNPVYNGLADCFLKTIKWEGIGGLYKGVGSPLAGQMFFRAVMFSTYYQSHSFFAERTPIPRARLSIPENYLCGAITGVASSLIEGPIDLFKTKLQIQIIRAKSGASIQYRNVFHAGYVIISNHGIQGAYQGQLATQLRNIPSCALYFGTFELTRDLITPEGKTVKDLTFMNNMFSGAMAGFSYWAFTYPFDVIKSAMQSDHIIKGERRFKSVAHCATTLWHEEGGWRRFYKGYTPCIMRSFVANAAMLATVEKCRDLLKM